ncbi:cupin domain-containing protein [Rhodoblastus sp.]|uniref:cupin domain-containing protein n=1 Tax=Rhodoblastus sp. TaxID=1962975 RepID=UPI003F958651
MVRVGNFFADLPDASGEEITQLLAAFPGARVERIVSQGQASPPDFWYDQAWAEWVVVLSGAAELLIEGEAAPRRLRPGDYLEIPAHVRHRVAWTDPGQPTIWLAVHGE